MLRKISRKIVPSLFLAVLILTVGSFFSGFSVSAAPISKSMPLMEKAGSCGNENEKITDRQNGSAADLMPCCVGTSHDNSKIVLPEAAKERLVFAKIASSQSSGVLTNSFSQLIPLSSSSPPSGPDVLSSIMKKE